MEQHLITTPEEHLIVYRSNLNCEFINATAACVSGNMDLYYNTVLEFRTCGLLQIYFVWGYLKRKTWLVAAV